MRLRNPLTIIQDESWPPWKLSKRNNWTKFGAGKCLVHYMQMSLLHTDEQVHLHLELVTVTHASFNLTGDARCIMEKDSKATRKHFWNSKPNLLLIVLSTAASSAAMKKGSILILLRIFGQDRKYFSQRTILMSARFICSWLVVDLPVISSLKRLNGDLP